MRSHTQVKWDYIIIHKYNIILNKQLKAKTEPQVPKIFKYQACGYTYKEQKV